MKKIWLTGICTFILVAFAKLLNQPANQNFSTLETIGCIIAVLCGATATVCWFLILADNFTFFAKIKTWYFFHLRRNFWIGEFKFRKRWFDTSTLSSLKQTASFGVTVASIWVWGFLSVVYSATIFFLIDLLGGL